MMMMKSYIYVIVTLMVVTSTFQLVVKAEDDNTLVEPSPATFAARLDGWTNLTLNGTLNSSSLSKERVLPARVCQILTKATRPV